MSEANFKSYFIPEFVDEDSEELIQIISPEDSQMEESDLPEEKFSFIISELFLLGSISPI